MRNRSPRRVAALGFGLATLLVPSAAAASELQERTRQAYERYVADAQRAFLERARTTDPRAPGDGSVRATPARQDGIIDVPDGLVHNWRAAILIRGVTLERAVERSQDYASYQSIYKSVVASQLLDHQGDTYRALLRVKGGGGGVSAVLQVRSRIEFVRLSPQRVVSFSASEEIREVDDAGSADERLRPPGKDRGYLWGAHTTSLFAAVPDGVIVDMETIGLSRRFPPMLGWLIEPIARRLGRRSLEATLPEFAASVRAPVANSATQSAANPSKNCGRDGVE